MTMPVDSELITVAHAREQIAGQWLYIDRYYRSGRYNSQSPSAGWGGTLRQGAAAFYVLLIRRLLNEHVPALLLTLGADWWPPGVPNDSRQHTRDWPLEEHAAKVRQRVARFGYLSDCWQGRLTNVLHWTALRVHDYIEDELTAAKKGALS